jgi:hypothetical protein
MAPVVLLYEPTEQAVHADCAAVKAWPTPHKYKNVTVAALTPPDVVVTNTGPNPPPPVVLTVPTVHDNRVFDVQTTDVHATPANVTLVTSLPLRPRPVPSRVTVPPPAKTLDEGEMDTTTGAAWYLKDKPALVPADVDTTWTGPAPATLDNDATHVTVVEDTYVGLPHSWPANVMPIKSP